MSLTDLDRQLYRDVTIPEAIAKGCDVVQLKYDGWWSRIETTAGWRKFYSRTKREFKSTHLLELDETSTMVGEHMQGTQWSQSAGRIGRTYLFDIWQYNDHNLSNLDYRSRYNVLKMVAIRLPDTFTIVPNYSIEMAPALWASHVEANDFEGLVFRKSTDPVASVVYRCKKVVTADLQALNFYEGQGKFKGTLGGINSRTIEDTQVDVGGGFSDADRAEIWNNQSKYINCWFEIEARAKFESGSFRHPNFIRWRPDKDDPSDVGRRETGISETRIKP
jgi:hypothetical protein